MRFIIVPYKKGSNSCKALKEKFIELGHKALRVEHNSTTFRPKETDILIYYGGHHTSRFQGKQYNTNRSLASDKLMAFIKFAENGLSTVPWTTEREIASEWLAQQKTVMGRSTLTGHSGQGITVHTGNDATLPNVPLFTQYVKKTYECRIHIFKERMIDAQIKRKARREETEHAEEANTFVRNHHTGWVYCREGFTPDTRAVDLAIAACASCNLDFGAVDLIYNQHYNQFYLLEVNTAPGLEGTTLTNYTNAFIGDNANV